MFYSEELQLVDKVQFSYDTFKIFKETDNNYLLQKLNSDSDEKKWVNKSLLEDEQSKISDSEIYKATQEKT